MTCTLDFNFWPLLHIDLITGVIVVRCIQSGSNNKVFLYVGHVNLPCYEGIMMCRTSFTCIYQNWYALFVLTHRLRRVNRLGLGMVVL